MRSMAGPRKFTDDALWLRSAVSWFIKHSCQGGTCAGHGKTRCDTHRRAMQDNCVEGLTWCNPAYVQILLGLSAGTLSIAALIEQFLRHLLSDAAYPRRID